MCEKASHRKSLSFRWLGFMGWSAFLMPFVIGRLGILDFLCFGRFWFYFCILLTITQSRCPHHSFVQVINMLRINFQIATA